MRVRNLSCPYCKKRTTRDKMVNHIEYNHSDQLPEGFTPLRMTFHVANNKPIEYRRPCRVCGNPTEWDENKGRYNLLCSNPVCKEKYVAKMKDSMGDKYGAYRPTATAEGLEKMLAARKISGKYKWSDGTIFNYTGSYELETLKFMDGGLNIKSEDLMVPGPVLEYEYNGEKHLYITDMYYRPYNLIIEVKDGGRSVNKNKEYAETRAKQMAKEKHVIQNTDYNYIRLTDKDMGQLMAVLADLKYHFVEKDNDRVIHVNENTPVAAIAPMVSFNPDKDVVIINYMKKKTFVDDSDYAIADSPKFDTVYTRDQDGILRKKDKSVLLGSYYTPYIIRGRRESIVEALYENRDKEVSKNFIYETAFGHPMYSKNQLQYEACEEYTDYYQDLENIRESFIFNEKDIYWNKDKFDSGEINLCFITGHSGSGKSTMAHKAEKDNVEVYELDDLIWNKMSYTMENFKEYGDMFYSYFSGQGKKFYYTVEDVENGTVKPVGDDYEKLLIDDFMGYAIKYANSHKDKKFIIEGVWLVDFYEPSALKDFAVYIKGTSLLVSRWRAAKRDSKDAPKGKRLINRFKNFFNWAIWQPNIDFERDLKKWREYYSKLESSVKESVVEEAAHDQEISKPYYIIAKDGSINACIDHKEYSKPMRARSSMLILKEIGGKLYVYLRKNKGEDLKHDGKYSAPGGGWNKSETPMDAAIREAQEEARINVDRVRFCGTLIEYHDTVHKWVKDNVENPNDWWYGYYTKIYVGFYAGKYTGKVADRDKESSFIKDGNFYQYDDIVYDIPGPYAEAIDLYIQGRSLTEAATEKDIARNQKLEPIFVVNTFTGTWDGKLIKAAAGMKYSHALISLNSKLSPMYSFDETEVPDPKNPDNKNMYKGLVIDHFDRYKKDMSFGDMRVIVIMVTKSTKKKIEEGIKYYVDRIDQTKYSYKKLIGHIIGSKEFSSFGDMAMVCSEFVDTILKYANIDISGKASANTRPDDLSTFHDKNNFFQVYEGKISQYNPSKIDKMIDNLRNNTEYKNLKSQTKNSMKSPFDHELGRENLIPGMVKRGGKAVARSFSRKKVLKEDGTFEYVDEIIEEGGETENE